MYGRRRDRRAASITKRAGREQNEKKIKRLKTQREFYDVAPLGRFGKRGAVAQDNAPRVFFSFLRANPLHTGRTSEYANRRRN